MKVLAVAWLLAALYSVRILAAVSVDTWVRTSTSWLGMWGLATHLASVILAPLAALLVWQRRDAGLIALMLLSGNALLYWTFYVIILGSTFWPVLLTLGLAVVTLVILCRRAILRIGQAEGPRSRA